nr:protein kinase-like domain, phloem protein 2-like protein [Tanacetum cinerariifolium]
SPFDGNRNMMFSAADFVHLKIPHENILSATNNFDTEHLFPEADYGNANVGEPLWSGELIQIDAWRFNIDEWDDEMEEEFWMEISLLSTLKHKNLVSLVGFCDEKGEKIIIIRLEIQGSLGNYLSDTKRLTWV